MNFDLQIFESRQFIIVQSGGRIMARYTQNIKKVSTKKNSDFDLFLSFSCPCTEDIPGISSIFQEKFIYFSNENRKEPLASAEANGSFSFPQALICKWFKKYLQFYIFLLQNLNKAFKIYNNSLSVRTISPLV
ncbi:MAG: hypothetical protein PHT34_05290 [Oscillospiraceae bacterium]|nr:hypothetical protein [Oscillospiraceae bacterium]